MLLKERQINGTLIYKGLSDLKAGDNVCLKYKHPDELGYYMENSFTRFKEEDLVDRVIEGKVHKVDTTSTKGTLFWIKQNKTDRSFYFFENEMEWIERRL